MDTILRLDGKTALVTGASSGLGLRFATVLAEAGAKVMLAARRIDRLEQLKREIAAKGGSAHVLALDVTDVAQARRAIATAEQAFAPIDILVNNSGVGGQKRLTEIEEEDYDGVMMTNARGAFFIAQAAARSMITRGAPGRIVNIASAAGLRPVAQIGIYSASKAALIHMTRAMALEWGRYGINVNAICPGYIETDINREYWTTEGGRKLINMLPRRRVGKPEDLDGLLLMLASEHSHFINGAVIAADDGLSAA
jgi:NAD(P)-dependent dehydrogenase (short-subunit alcohol dehydrogenase family)